MAHTRCMLDKQCYVIRTLPVLFDLTCAFAIRDYLSH